MILYHSGKANVAADALTRKMATISINEVCLKMIMITPHLDQIREAHVEAMKEEHKKREHIAGLVASFDYDIWGLLNLHWRI